MGNKDGTKIDKALVDNVVLAQKTGFHHLDGAEVYGNEGDLGEAIKAAGIPRNELFVTTKINGTEVQDTEASFAESLQKLKLDYVDLYLIHAPFFAKGSKKALQEKWADMEAIQKSGRAKSIGVSNFLQEDLEAVLETAKVKPSINQIEYHPYLQHGDLVPFHKKHGIATAAYGPLSAVVTGAPGPLDPVYKKLAEKYGVSSGEIALRWCIDQDVVALTTSGKESRLKDYLRVADFKLTSDEIEEISRVGDEKHFRGFWGHIFKPDDRR